MSLSEILYRLRKHAYIQIQKLGLLTAKNVPEAKCDIKVNEFIKGTKNVNIDAYLCAADEILQGNSKIFAIRHSCCIPQYDWNQDPRTGKKAPMQFGKTLNYRDATTVGDIKYLWEPNRHLHLVTLAQAYYLSGDQRYIDRLRMHIDSWMDKCPYLLGPNWVSSLELAIRLINWSIVWQLTGGEGSPVFEGQGGKLRLQRFLESVYRHEHFIQGHFSRYSSGNNHLIGEAAGLFIATTVWPYWDKCIAWRKTAKNVLEREARLQNTSDGVNKEQAISYQQFVLDFLILSGMAGKANNLEFSSVYWKRIETMIEYLASIMDVSGNVPMIGDADDGYVTRLSQEDEWCPYKSLLSTGALLFERGAFKLKAGPLDDKTRWILGDEVEEPYNGLEEKVESLPISRSFVEGGYYIVGADLETAEEIRLIVDAGPLGYEAIAAHGHADALAITLSISGREFLIDPGTYAYHTKKKWRDYFRGTEAHNTISIDSRDQSVSGGNFMWLKKANAWCELWESDEHRDHFIGTHDGYTRLEDPVIHRREIILSKAERKIVVKDSILCHEKHDVKGYWHFSEKCTLDRMEDGIKVVNGGKAIVLRCWDGDADYKVIEGDSERPGGWVSRQFDVKQPAPTIVSQKLVHGDTTLTTEIHCI